MTEPPAKARESASFKPFLAAWAVLTFALIDIFIPIKPQIAEAAAPIAKPMAISRESTNQIITKIITATIAITEYWRVK